MTASFSIKYSRKAFCILSQLPLLTTVSYRLKGKDLGKKKPSIPAVLTVNISVCGILSMFVCVCVEPTKKPV